MEPFKIGNVVRWCGVYGDVVNDYNESVSVRFDEVMDTISFDKKSGEIDSDFYQKFPHMPKLEHAQRPGVYPRTINVSCSITGIMSRLEDKSFTRASLWKHYGFSINEFIKHFETTKKAVEEGNYEIARQFFNIYC